MNHENVTHACLRDGNAAAAAVEAVLFVVLAAVPAAAGNDKWIQERKRMSEV